MKQEDLILSIRIPVFFVTTDQFAYVAGVNGIMIREKTATNFYMGSYFAESLLLTETGNITGAIQIAGTDSVTQIPFFITTLVTIHLLVKSFMLLQLICLKNQ